MKVAEMFLEHHLAEHCMLSGKVHICCRAAMKAQRSTYPTGVLKKRKIYTLGRMVAHTHERIRYLDRTQMSTVPCYTRIDLLPLSKKKAQKEPHV